MSKELYVRDISFEATEEDLINLFSVSGKVVHIHMITDPKTGQFRGSAFIKMASDKEGKDALNCLDGASLLNRHISVTKARPKGQAPADASEEKPKRNKARTSSGWSRVPPKPKKDTRGRGKPGKKPEDAPRRRG